MREERVLRRRMRARPAGEKEASLARQTKDLCNRLPALERTGRKEEVEKARASVRLLYVLAAKKLASGLIKRSLAFSSRHLMDSFVFLDGELKGGGEGGDGGGKSSTSQSKVGKL